MEKSDKISSMPMTDLVVQSEDNTNAKSDENNPPETMDTNDSDEINVDSSPNGDESIEVIDRGTPDPMSPMKAQVINQPVIAVTSFPSTGFNITSSKPSTAQQRRQKFQAARLVHSQEQLANSPYHQLRPEHKMQRHDSDPVLSKKALMEGFSLDSKILPKQHSEPGPMLHERKPKYLIEGPDESYFKVTCGTLEGRLIWHKFVCPGINVRCIRLDSKHELITPKELVKEAGKQTLKDWKRAIRINTKMLRKLMDDNDLDYYRHEINCSNTCKSNKTMSGIDSTGSSISRDSSMSSMNPSSSFEEPLRIQHQPSFESRQTVGSFERSSSEDSADADIPLMLENATQETVTSCHNFWSNVKKEDLLDDVLQEIKNRITILESTISSRGQGNLRPEDSVSLQNIVNSLDMMPQIKTRLAGRKEQMNQRSLAVSESVADLRTRLDLAMREEKALAERKRQLDKTLATAPADNQKGRKKPRIVKLARQPAIEHPAARPNFVHSPHPVNLNGPIFIPDGINAMAAWHNIPGQLRTASDVQYVRAPYITHVPLQTQPPHPGSPSPGCQAGTSTRIQEETQITHIRSNLVKCSIKSSPEHSTASSSPMPP